MAEVAVPSPFDLYAIPLDAIKSSDGRGGIPPNFNQYLFRNIDLAVSSQQRFPLVYAKLCRLLVVGSLCWDDPKNDAQGSRQSWRGEHLRFIASPLSVDQVLD